MIQSLIFIYFFFFLKPVCISENTLEYIFFFKKRQMPGKETSIYQEENQNLFWVFSPVGSLLSSCEQL